MANYNLTVNSTFQPFSFDDYLKPYAIYDKAYREVEDTYADLATKANALKRLAKDERDKKSKAYKQYTKYSEELENLAEKLNREGLNPSSRQAALKMKSRYSSDISPIEEAYIKRDKLAEEQRQARLKDPSLMYDVDYSIAGIDDIMANTNSTYNPVSGKSIYDRGIEAGKSSSLRRVLPPEIQKALGNQYFELTERRGYSATEAANFLANQNNIPELKEMIDNIINQSGANALNDKDKQRALDYAINGAMVGLSYNEDRKYMKNEDYLNPYEQWKWNREKNPPELPPVSNVNQVFSWEGTEVNRNKNVDIQLMDDDLRNLNRYLEESSKGKVPESYKETRYINKGLDRLHQTFLKQRNVLIEQGIDPEYLDKHAAMFPSYYRVKSDFERLESLEKLQPHAITKEVEVKNPLYESYNKLAKKYGSDDINFLIKKQQEEITKKASINRIAYMNTNTSELGSRHINTSLFSGIDLDDKDELGKMIHKKGDSDDVPSKEELTDIISKNTKYGIDPINKKMYAFTPGKGTYEINAAAILNPLNIPTAKGMMTGYEYLKEVSRRAVQGKPWEGKSNYTNAIYNEELTHLFNALIARANSGAPETSSTNSDMSTYYTDSDLIKIAREIQKQNKQYGRRNKRP